MPRFPMPLISGPQERSATECLRTMGGQGMHGKFAEPPRLGERQLKQQRVTPARVSPKSAGRLLHLGVLQ